MLSPTVTVAYWVPLNVTVTVRSRANDLETPVRSTPAVPVTWRVIVPEIGHGLLDRGRFTSTLLTVTESGFDRIPIARRAEALRGNDRGWSGQMKAIEEYLRSTP